MHMVRSAALRRAGCLLAVAGLCLLGVAGLPQTGARAAALGGAANQIARSCHKKWGKKLASHPAACRSFGSAADSWQ